ncbi:hypothetical protein V6Z12_D06G021500 [Gossypium hirsutum]
MEVMFLPCISSLNCTPCNFNFVMHVRSRLTTGQVTVNCRRRVHI